MEAANRNSRPAFSPAFSSCVPGFSGGSLRPCRRRNSRLDAPRAEMPFRRPHRPAAQGRCLPLSAPLEAPGRQDSLTEITAVCPCPALVQHIAGTVKRKAQAAFPVIVGAHPRDQSADFLLLVTGQLPGVHLRLRATMARRAGLHDQRPELLPALFFLSFALLVITASLTRVVIVPAGVRYFLHHSFKRAACKIHSHSSVSSSHGGVSSSSGSSAIPSSSPSSYSQ